MRTSEDYYNRNRSFEYKMVFWGIVALVIFTLLLACEKEGTYCYRCEKNALRLNLTMQILEVYSPDIYYNECNWTEEDAKAFEKKFTNLYTRGTCEDEIIWQKCKFNSLLTFHS